jgi:hypothetical protein
MAAAITHARNVNLVFMFLSARFAGEQRLVSSFNPKPEAMAGSGIDRPHVAPTIASGFGLKEYSQNQYERVLTTHRVILPVS